MAPPLGSWTSFSVRAASAAVQGVGTTLPDGSDAQPPGLKPVFLLRDEGQKMTGERCQSRLSAHCGWLTDQQHKSEHVMVCDAGTTCGHG